MTLPDLLFWPESTVAMTTQQSFWQEAILL